MELLQNDRSSCCTVQAFAWYLVDNTSKECRQTLSVINDTRDVVECMWSHHQKCMINYNA